MAQQLQRFPVAKPAYRFLSSNVSRLLDLPEVEQERFMCYCLVLTFKNRELFRKRARGKIFTSNTGKIGKMRSNSEFFTAEDLFGYLRKSSFTNLFNFIQTFDIGPLISKSCLISSLFLFFKYSNFNEYVFNNILCSLNMKRSWTF
jgi:hypothetical protein